jgi:hypothetical protein
VASDAGQANRVTVTGTPAAVTVTDGATTLIAGTAASDLVIDLGDGNDTLTVLASVPVT